MMVVRRMRIKKALDEFAKLKMAIARAISALYTVLAEVISALAIAESLLFIRWFPILTFWLGAGNLVYECGEKMKKNRKNRAELELQSVTVSIFLRWVRIFALITSLWSTLVCAAVFVYEKCYVNVVKRMFVEIKISLPVLACRWFRLYSFVMTKVNCLYGFG